MEKTIRPSKDLAKRAKSYWEARDLASLESLQSEPAVTKDSAALYFVGLALNALNKRREAIECWRKARELDRAT